MDTTGQWLTTNEAAKELRISPRTLNNARSTGTGIVIEFLKIGSRVFYRKSDVDAYIEKHTYVHTGQCKAVL
jgi:excisionase family DNA binding protein